MEKIISCFIPVKENEDCSTTVNQMLNTGIVEKIFLMSAQKPNIIPKNCEWIECKNFYSTGTIKSIAENTNSKYILIYTKTSPLQFGEYSLERFASLIEDTEAGLVYSDYYEKKNGELCAHPVIDYQIGSLRDDFNFGSVLFYRSEAVKNAVAKFNQEFEFAGFYYLRLKVSQTYSLFRIPEFLYTEIELDTRKSGEKLFDYVDPKNRQVQIEMEKACTEHLKNTGGYLKPEFSEIKFDEDKFETEASVVIPVRNRVRTIEDAIKSILIQKTKFKFNLIIVNNHSTDGTTEIIDKYAKENDLIVHIIPEGKDLGIGGCWTAAVMDSRCGRFAVQLDSDDLYIDENTLQKIVDSFYEQQCAMVVGTYKMVNVDLEMIAPGIIDHKEWTPDNGRNNALRINGLGAPRAFYTPVIRKIKVPNVSYGEDYALGLAISRNYQIGRIYEPLYLCRRWDGNSDAAVDIVKQNAYNTYKDRIRSVELMARIAKNKNK
ncbi:MAG: glycosyltransferase family 2 protein [Prevotellaceae bacterium]|jgi:hypothetical protein|nr:glycosyltransferase family 2 protein [Prevotellaceae bacterium]